MPTPTPTPGERPREVRTLNFDLSWGEFTDLQLHVLNSSSDRVPLSVHDDETRAQFRELIPALQDVPDELLTHFAETSICRPMRCSWCGSGDRSGR